MAFNTLAFSSSLGQPLSLNFFSIQTGLANKSTWFDDVIQSVCVHGDVIHVTTCLSVLASMFTWSDEDIDTFHLSYQMNLLVVKVLGQHI